ncbi:hypothetical protein RJT34_01427 [Clitoria ternatea]|uniref:RING-type E3 ubiquitin transferase n=1 Tax=Clitoria ternatea TaxID=43366 RepID=A0AAN9Q3B2_CLITE
MKPTSNLIRGELTPKSDVYSFGVILLRLVTGRPALGITKEVKYALDVRKLKSFLDPLACQAQQLEVMRDPHVAADGVTYGAEAIGGVWLESGHALHQGQILSLHIAIVPNDALRHAIQNWLQNH